MGHKFKIMLLAAAVFAFGIVSNTSVGHAQSNVERATARAEKDITNRALSTADSGVDTAIALAYKNDAEDAEKEEADRLTDLQNAYAAQAAKLDQSKANLAAAQAAGADAATISGLQSQVTTDSNQLNSLQTSINDQSVTLRRAQSNTRIATNNYNMALSTTGRRATRIADTAVTSAFRLLDAAAKDAADAANAAIRAADRAAYSASRDAARDASLTARQARANASASARASRATGRTTAAAIATGKQCGSGTLGGLMCNLLNSTSRVPGVVVGFAYLMGLICGFMGIMKLKDLVEGSNQVTMWDPIKRFVAGGMFFALPYVINAVITSIQGKTASYLGNTDFAKTDGTGAGLDTMIVKLVADIMEPMIWLTGAVGIIAGLIFVFIGISRLMKSEQDGHRGPTGIGTLMTFVVAGALFSMNSMVTFINNSIFGAGSLKTNAALQYTGGLTSDAVTHVNSVFSGIIAFAIVLGWISIARGLFIVRGVSEGNHQASMMGAITHLIGGALAINLGGLITAVQNTLGISTYGILFN